MLPIIKPVILCGGSGTRLWPLSRESFPKQFAPLIDGKTLLSLTINRVKQLGAPICVTTEEYRFFVRNHLKEASIFSDSDSSVIILEPAGRNTAPAMVSASLIPSVKSSDLLLFVPSDHFMPDIDAFIATIQSGVAAAQSGYIVTFGVQPNFPSAAYGYIQQGSQISGFDFLDSSTFLVNHFLEKPSLAEAEKMVLSGKYLWNAGIFLCRASVLVDAFSEHAPDILKSCQKAVKASLVDGDFVRLDREPYLACRSESIDYAIMEHFEKIALVPFKGAWSDVGSWNAVSVLSPPDESGNRINGQGVTLHSRNTYVNAPHRPVVALGTSDLVVVDTADAVLVASVDALEQVKDIVAKLKKDGVPEAVQHRRVARPWGWYDSIDMGDGFLVKRIVVSPGASLSLQMHHYRAEHWIVVKGTAKVLNGENIFLLKENQSTYIPVGVKHRLENPSQTDLEMIEVQSGSYLGEDDIIRFEDSYGRS